MRGRALIAAAALGVALTGCHPGDHEPAVDTGDLTRQQYDEAVDLALHEVENQDARITSATAVVKPNAAKHAPSNTGHRCTGERVLKVRLIGTFPHTDVGGPPGGDPNGGRVTEMDIKADPATGDACLIGVRTSPTPAPEPEGTVLQLDTVGE
jgi:hypothetical protein